jgi:hypothetical protein
MRENEGWNHLAGLVSPEHNYSLRNVAGDTANERLPHRLIIGVFLGPGQLQAFPNVPGPTEVRRRRGGVRSEDGRDVGQLTKHKCGKGQRAKGRHQARPGRDSSQRLVAASHGTCN